MGRLEDIVARNQHPRRFRKQKFPVGIMLSGFVLLVLVLMIFTDLGMAPAPSSSSSPASPSAAPGKPQGGKRVDGVLLYRAPATRDAAVGSAGSAAAQPR